MQNGAFDKIDKVVRLGLMKTDFDGGIVADCGQHCPAAQTLRNEKRRDVCVDRARLERRHDRVALPSSVEVRRHMLHGASTTHGEMLANRRNTVGALLQNLFQARSCTGPLRENALSWKRERNKDWTCCGIGDAITLSADPLDFDVHRFKRHVVLQSEIPRYRSHQE